MPPKKTKRKAVSTAGRRNRCRTLLVIDNEPIRRAALRDCQTALRQREKAHREWERYDRKDRPAFDQWFHGVFGAEVTQLRELSDKILEAETLIRTVEYEAFRSRIPPWEAYARVMQARETGEPVNGEDADAGDEERDDDFFETFEGEGDPFDEFDGDWSDAFRGMFGGSEEEAREAFERMSGRGRSAAAPGPEACARVKEVYRALVRRLHPDKIEQVDAVKQDLWHAVQEAYRARDLDRLESLLSRCDLEEGVVSESTSISQLRRSWGEIKKAVSSLRAQLRRARKDVAWKFSSQTPSQLAALRSRLARDVRGDLRIQHVLYEELREIIKHWEKRGKDQPRAEAAKKAKKKAKANVKKAPGRSKASQSSSGGDPFQGEFAF